MSKKNLYFLLFLFAFLGCSNLNNGIRKNIPRTEKINTSQDIIAIFLDGTTNTEKSHTNVMKLYNLFTLNNNTNIKSIYIPGVGNQIGTKIFGGVFGAGIGRDVRSAYKFIGENYKIKKVAHLVHGKIEIKEVKPKIYIFGFSRGAYAARMLTGLLYTAGPGLEDGIVYDKNKIRKIYSLHRSNREKADQRVELIKKVIPNPQSVNVDFLGLWDTVESLAFFDYKEDIFEVNDYHLDQLHNVKKGAHALSLDDRRARLFTPILLTGTHLLSPKKKLSSDNSTPKYNDIYKEIYNKIEEVWFSGTHFDIGGNSDNSELSSISLNWMIEELLKAEPEMKNTLKTTKITSSHKGKSGTNYHLYGTNYRSLVDYIDDNNPDYKDGYGYYKNGDKKLGKIIKVHSSVIDRLRDTQDNNSTENRISIKNEYRTQESITADHLEYEWIKDFKKSKDFEFKDKDKKWEFYPVENSHIEIVYPTEN